MRKFKITNVLLFCIVAVFIYACSKPIQNQYRTWSVYKGDQSSSSYSPLKQITKANVGQLKVAWAFTPSDAAAPSTGRGGGGSGGGECNPIIIDGTMYVVGARNRLYAIDAVTGKEKWAFNPFTAANEPGVGGVKRGCTYWESPDKTDKRILYTAGTNLFAVNAETGKIISTFGKDGKVSMNEHMRDDPAKITVIPTSPGIIFQDLIIMGTEVLELYDAVPGYVRAYNVKTGELAWVFHTVPLPGEFGYNTWSKDSYQYVGGTNNWAGMSVDDKRGMVFFSTGSAANDYYGGGRVGNNLFADCVVALDARTGTYKWHFQTIHHDLWDYDLSAPPNLITVTHDGKKTDAVAQTGKVGFVYVLDRETGKPLFPIEERPVPKSDIPGEVSSPTQPFPTKPAAYARQNFTKDLLNDISPAMNDSILKRYNSMRYEGLFTPPSIKGTLMLPGSRGGIEWGGAAFEPKKGVLFIRSNDNPEIQTMRKIETAPVGGTTYNRGKMIFTNYCAACHGADRKGDEGLGYPNLVDVKNRLTKEQVISKVNTGGGKMPGFAPIIKGEEDAIVAFLFDIQAAPAVTGRRVTQNAHPLVDTLPRWQNTTLYSSWTVPAPPVPGAPAPAAGGRGNRGVQAIKGPWATLNAINLNTGEYEWKIPFDEGSTGPTVTAGGVVFVAGTTFRAYDKDTGALLWDSKISGVSGNAAVYMAGKKQYVTVALSGAPGAPGANFVTFELPDKK